MPSSEFTKQKSKKKTKKKKGDESEGEDDDDDVDDDDDDDIDDLSDEEPDFADADFGDAFDSPAGSDEEALSDGDAEDFDEEGMAFSEEGKSTLPSGSPIDIGLCICHRWKIGFQ